MDVHGREEFSNALCDRFKPERPDVLAVIALDGEKIMGMAGCSADTTLMWQIGIDVLPEYRDRGIGKTLVTLLKNEAIRRGAIPYYGTSLSNIFNSCSTHFLKQHFGGCLSFPFLSFPG